MEYDYGIIGAGAAGSHILHAMLDDPYFRDKQILILDRDSKSENDKTWCFWELMRGRWDDLVFRQWSHGQFISSGGKAALDLAPYVYKMIRSDDFYDYTRERIAAHDHVSFRQEEVKSVGKVKGNPVVLLETGEQVTVGTLFDSRIDKRFYQEEDSHSRVWQHFKGWVIETADHVFDPDEFVMMDFRVKHGNETSFTYILPFTESKALVEYTFFSPVVHKEEVYDARIREYLENVLRTTGYSVLDTESGIIPMTDYPFHHLNTDKHIRIGTAGSWVKPSSGYSFKNAERKSRQIIANIKAGESPGSHLFRSRHRLYDTIFLDLLYRKNHLGEEIFTSMYLKNDIRSIFKFLDEETTMAEEYQVIRSFAPAPFLAAFWRKLARSVFPLK